MSTPMVSVATWRLLLISTSVLAGPRPRKFTVETPSAAWAPRVSNWLVSPNALELTFKFLIISTIEGSPWFSRSSRVTTSTGNAASSGVPLI